MQIRIFPKSLFTGVRIVRWKRLFQGSFLYYYTPNSILQRLFEIISHIFEIFRQSRYSNTAVSFSREFPLHMIILNSLHDFGNIIQEFLPSSTYSYFSSRIYFNILNAEDFLASLFDDAFVKKLLDSSSIQHSHSQTGFPFLSYSWSKWYVGIEKYPRLAKISNWLMASALLGLGFRL